MTIQTKASIYDVRRELLVVFRDRLHVSGKSEARHTFRPAVTSSKRAVKVEGLLACGTQANAAKIGTMACCGDAVSNRSCSRLSKGTASASPGHAPSHSMSM